MKKLKLELNYEEFSRAVELARKNPPSVETFAWWSLERELQVSCSVENKDDMILEEKDIDLFLEEAAFYLVQDAENWPHDALARYLEKP